MSKRVVVTGLGITLPGAYNIESAWSRILKGESFISSIDNFDTSGVLTKYAGEIKFSDRDYSGKSGFMYDNLFDTSECGDKKEVRRLDKFILYGIHSSIQAVKDANIEDGVDKSRVGVMIGSGIGGIAGIDENAITLNNDGARKISPFFIPSVLVTWFPVMYL